MDRSIVNESADKNFRQALVQMYGIQLQLSLPDAVVEKAAYFYRKSLEKGLIRGRFISTWITATVYAACVDNSTSKDLKDIANASNETEYDIVRYYKTLTEQITLDKIHADAIEQYDKTLKINPDESRILYDKAIECSISEKYLDCISYCDKIIEKVPTDTGTWNLRDSAYEDLKNYNQAMAAGEKLVKIGVKDKDTSD